MKSLKMKTLVVAVALAAAGGAHAATINTDGYNGGAGLGSGTGAGDIIFTVYDPLAAQSLALNLNLTATNFINNNASLINAFSVTDSGLASFFGAHSADLSSMQWNMGGISNNGFGPNAGILTTNGSLLSTINPVVNGPVDGNALTNAMGNIESYAINNNGHLSSVNSFVSNTSTNPPTGWTGGTWGTSFGGQFFFNNAETGFSSGQLMSFIALGATDVTDLSGVPISNTFSNGKWVVDTSLGKVSYVGSVSAVPVPAAVWLFGSGLLGLVGIGRRKKA
ncbi:MAG TPA: VPLPA-CTERM sorting domain-containing protein [Candidatus Methylomirabilis sp.]|nr:VPLPA-CTERM sorting domain-containing protein [Candidatus Methylomirabilis sp.]